jgi:uronate dehydrogenase
MSDNVSSWWDNTPARLLGYAPQDSSEPFRAAACARQPSLDMTNRATLYQGGGFVTQGPFEP